MPEADGRRSDVSGTVDEGSGGGLGLVQGASYWTAPFAGSAGEEAGGVSQSKCDACSPLSSAGWWVGGSCWGGEMQSSQGRETREGRLPSSPSESGAIPVSLGTCST